MLILRTIEQEIFKSEVNIVNVYAHISPVMHLLNNKRHEVLSIEEKYGITLNFHHDVAATSDNFSIEKIRVTEASKRNKQEEPKPALSLSVNLFDGVVSESITENKPSGAAPSQKSRRAKKWKDRPQDKNSEPVVAVEAAPAIPAATQETPTAIAEPKNEKPKRHHPKKHKEQKVDATHTSAAQEAVQAEVRSEVPTQQAKQHRHPQGPKRVENKQADTKPHVQDNKQVQAKPTEKAAEAPTVSAEEATDKTPRRRKTVRKPAAKKDEA